MAAIFAKSRSFPLISVHLSRDWGRSWVVNGPVLRPDLRVFGWVGTLGLFQCRVSAPDIDKVTGSIYVQLSKPFPSVSQMYKVQLLVDI